MKQDLFILFTFISLLIFKTLMKKDHPWPIKMALFSVVMYQ